MLFCSLVSADRLPSRYMRWAYMKYAMAIGTPTTVTPSIILSVIKLDEALNISMPALS